MVARGPQVYPSNLSNNWYQSRWFDLVTDPDEQDNGKQWSPDEIRVWQLPLYTYLLSEKRGKQRQDTDFVCLALSVISLWQLSSLLLLFFSFLLLTHKNPKWTIGGGVLESTRNDIITNGEHLSDYLEVRDALLTLGD